MKDFSLEWPKLSNAERVAFCESAARQAEAEAETSDPSCRQAYRTLAAQWRLLAVEIERKHGPSEETSSSIGH